MSEHTGLERSWGGSWRRKGGLEPPLQGRFGRENKRLTFAPPGWYDLLVVACLIFGTLTIVFGAVQGQFLIFQGVIACLLFGGAILISGFWAALSNERVLLDLTQQGYVRLEGQGFGKRLVRGKISELDALQLVAEEFPTIVPGRRHVVYRLVLHWKHRHQPLLVVEREDRDLGAGVPIHQHAGSIRARGIRYAQAIGIPFYDNAHYHSPGPVPVV